MRTSLKLLLICLALILGACGDPMEHAHCDDTEMKRVPSPDGKLVIVIYNRTCSGGTSLTTYADVEDPAVRTIWPRQRHSEVCFLATLGGGYHQMEARWLDGKHIEVSSPDQLDPNYGVLSKQDNCNDITVSYLLTVKPPPAEAAPDKNTVALIRKAIDQTEGCINEKYASDHADYIRGLVDDGEDRRAAELLCGNLWFGKCPVSQETYDLFEQIDTSMHIDPTCLQNLKPLVR